MVHLFPDLPAQPYSSYYWSCGDRCESSTTFSASFGVAGWDQFVPADAAVDVLVARCDECVYESKAGGRNRVTAKSMD
jgi:PleD family two-component response regulator